MHATALGSTVARDLLHSLVDHGYTLATGVPCSLLNGAFRLLEEPGDDVRLAALRYVPAPREDSAVGIASGAVVAGERAVVLMQNSGLGYCLNVLTSFNLIYDVPVLLVVSWRGHDGNDAVEHDVIGAELLRLLQLFGLPHTLLDPADPAGSVSFILDQMDEKQRCGVLIVREGI
ncbi:thiamine pyrophosphate-binding protein [Streptomyces sp. CSDS2]|uniref:thiamine pyrophosphate-binding protein n=1 Tax=Streptomyces sp. CSDS2 TaxID=3055051 RepID=UPI0025AF685F|nr:thiamine pyrophosphate-binding protein [Streptomyces sp. CSDS2]MDN3260531.1 thiamine pyrophosphate-binding protein [Streptomyces sp. CSDS2]